MEENSNKKVEKLKDLSLKLTRFNFHQNKSITENNNKLTPRVAETFLNEMLVVNIPGQPPNVLCQS